jgi:hypothetical protein
VRTRFQKFSIFKLKNSKIPSVGSVAIFGLFYGGFLSYKAGAFWDLEADYSQSLLNKKWLTDGLNNESDVFFEMMHSYSYLLTYISEVPKILIEAVLRTDLNFISPSWISYRNIFNFSIFAVGVAALYFWLNFNKAKNNLFLLILLLSFPSVNGYGFFDSKDIPVFSAACLSLALLRATTSPNLKSSVLQKNYSLFLISFFMVVFSIGVRPSTFLIIAPALILVTLYAQIKRLKGILPPISLGVMVGIVLIYLTTATFKEEGPIWFYRSYLASSQFTMWEGGHNLSWGRIFPAGETRTYPFFVLASQIPDWLFVTAFILIILTARHLKYFSTKLINSDKTTIIVNSYPYFMMISLLVFFFIKKPILYDDLRQVLFIWAFIMVCAVEVTMFVLLHVSTRYKLIAKTLIISAILVTQSNGILLQQYSYTYKNLIARISQPTGFETDYWAISSKEASQRIIKDFNASNETKVLAQPPGSFGIYLRELTYMNVSSNPDLFVTISRPTGLPDNFQNCPIVAQIEKPQLFSTSVLMAYIRKCPKA